MGIPCQTRHIVIVCYRVYGHFAWNFTRVPSLPCPRIFHSSPTRNVSSYQSKRNYPHVERSGTECCKDGDPWWLFPSLFPRDGIFPWAYNHPYVHSLPATSSSLKKEFRPLFYPTWRFQLDSFLHRHSADFSCNLLYIFLQGRGDEKKRTRIKFRLKYTPTTRQCSMIALKRVAVYCGLDIVIPC